MDFTARPFFIGSGKQPEGMNEITGKLTALVLQLSDENITEPGYGCQGRVI